MYFDTLFSESNSSVNLDDVFSLTACALDLGDWKEEERMSYDDERLGDLVLCDAEQFERAKNMSANST